MAEYIRKTHDVWCFYVNYGQGWEHETTELTFEAMKTNRKGKEACYYGDQG